jgi:hypothetical protein
MCMYIRPTMVPPHEGVQQTDEHVLSHSFFEALVRSKGTKHETIS